LSSFNPGDSAAALSTPRSWANGALLSAVALMAGGWDGETSPAPGFPKDGRWQVRSEGLGRLP